MKIFHFIARLVFPLLLALPCFAAETPKATGDGLSTEQTKQVEKVVHHYLVENPQVLVESFQTLKNREMGKRQQNTENAVAKHSKEVFNAVESPVLGNPEGDVTVVEFLDYRCPHCQTMGEVINNLIKKDPKLRVVVKELAILGKESQYAAKAALAAAKQNKFAALHEAFLRNNAFLDETKVKKMAAGVGINLKKLEVDMQNSNIDRQLSNNLALAQDLQIEGTPAFLIKNRVGGKTLFLRGAASQESLQEMIGKTRSGIRS